MFRTFHSLPLLAAVCAWTVALAPQSRAAVPTAPGIYATFVVSRAGAPVGEFSCKLEYQKTPRTVANFVGLAEGSRAWVDRIRGGVSRKPFYDGRVIFRVDSGFVIQSGSANDTNAGGGPGYNFHDEFDPTLRHTAAGVLSMANSGPDSNTSQFFITLAQGAANHLDDVHSVFGNVTDSAGMDVVLAIQQGDVFDSVTITRNGAAAQAFDVNAQGLPTVTDADPAIAKTPSGFELNYVKQIDSEYFVFHTGDFASWSQLSGSEIYTSSPTQAPRDVTSVATGNDRRFFSVARVEYPDRTPPFIGAGRQLTLRRSAGDFLTFTFTSATTGTFTYNGASTPTYIVGQYTTTASTSRNQLLISHVIRLEATLVGFVTPTSTLDVSLTFDYGNSGATTGLLTTSNGPFSMNGTFTVSN